jgi:L-ascorbate metabolism protein UlaG (beta-lactamase superfamily)
MHMKRNILFIAVHLILLLWIGGCSKDGDPEKSCTAAPVVSAGTDQIIFGNDEAVLVGITDKAEGTWTITDGAGGEIVTGHPVKFKGNANTAYKLKWEASNECGVSSDEVIVDVKGCGDQTILGLVDNIHWIQQACFRIESSNFTIYTDPNSIKQRDTADIIMISHPHGDHYTIDDLNLLTGPNTILVAPEEVTYSGTLGRRVILKPGEELNAFGGCVNVKAVPAYNINKTQFHDKSKNWVGYLIIVDGVTIYHTGDTERIPEMKDITADIIMLPLGQTYTFDSVEDAVEAAKDVKAKVAIPMHFGLYEGTIEDAQTFKNLLDGIIPVVIKQRGE